MVPIPLHPRMLPSAPSFSRPVVARPSLKTFDAATMYPPSGVDRMSWNPEKFVPNVRIQLMLPFASNFVTAEGSGGTPLGLGTVPVVT